MDINIERELRRDLLKLCTEELVDLLIERGEAFYQTLFPVYGLEFTKENVREKRKFVISATRHYILNRLSNCLKPFYERADEFAPFFEKGSPIIVKKYEISDCSMLKAILSEHIDNVMYIMSDCPIPRYEEFEKRFAKELGVKRVPLKKYLEDKLEDSETDFLKALRTVAKGKSDN